MASTTFIDQQTIIYAAWLNDVNNAVYNGVFPNGTLSLTNLSVSGSVSGSGFTTLVNNTLSAPGAIGSVTPNTGAFTTLTLTNKLAVAQGGTGLATLTANNVILGNGTSTPSFVAPGTSGNVLTSNGTTWASASLAVKGLGYGNEVWHNVTASRSASTSYTNSNTYPIMVNIWGINGAVVTLTIGGVSACQSGINSSVPAVNLTGIVPPGLTYSISSCSSIVLWSELY